MKEDMKITSTSKGWPEIVLSSKDESEILSSVNLPISPPNTNSNNSQSQKYHHILSSQSINPCMDLIAIISRDINAPSSSSSSNNNGVDPHAGLPPPPPGMSAARSAALMKMRMAQRAKALAAAGIKDPSISAQSTSSVNTQAIIKCASLRLSLWRMSSIAGESGARVWDVGINVPDRMEDPKEGQSEYEEISVTSFVWSPDGLYLSLVLNVQRRSNSDMQVKRKEQYIMLYALQDGQQVRIIPFSDNGEVSELEWVNLPLQDGMYRCTSGSTKDILSLLGPLSEITSTRDDQESKARQRQRMFQAMRDQNKTKIEEERRAKDLIMLGSKGLGRIFSDFPHALPKRNELIKSSSNPTETLSSPKKAQKETILIARSNNSVHFFFNGVFYLGRINVNDGIIESRFDYHEGILHLIRRQFGVDKIEMDQIITPLRVMNTKISTLLHIQDLSSFAFTLMTYAYDSIIVMRSTYQTLHADCIQTWNRRARLTAKRYATHLPSELLMLLSTGYANDTMMSVLLGNDTLSENNLKKMRNDILSSFTTIENTVGKLSSALQRMILVFEECLGCALWEEEYGGFFDKQSQNDIRAILNRLSEMLRQSNKMIRLLGKEQLAWLHFYRFWLYERAKQEALRDGKLPAEAQTIAIAAVGDTPYSVMLLVEFFNRGFYNVSIENMLNIKMDAKTRGDEVEDDDEEDGDKSRARESKVPIAATPMKVTQFELSDGEDEKTSEDPWYRDPHLLDKIEETIQTLREPPKIDQLFSTVNKKTPSPEDFARLGEIEEFHVGTISGLSEKEFNGMSSSPSLKDLLIDSITIASPLFSKGFAQWVQHYGKDGETRKSETYSLCEMTISDSRTDGIKSSARQNEGRISTNDNIPIVRQCFDSNNSDGRSAIVMESDLGNSILLLIVNSTETLIAIANLSQKVKVIDMGFYSAEEIVLLLQREVESEDIKMETLLVSIRLEELLFKPIGENGLEDHIQSNQFNAFTVEANRCFSINQGGGGDAKKLALNRRKEVCATLDDEGHLVYWDLVQQTSETVEEKDEEMI